MNNLQVILAISAVWTVYVVALYTYRLLLSPLTRFPGPKLAAMSHWYEFYWDVVQPGRFTWHLWDLHAKYGPIVRIGPNELHILDSSFFDELYTRAGAVRHKSPRMSARFGPRKDCFSTWDHHLHRTRRTAINPFFSAKRIASVQSLLRAKLTKMAKCLITAQEVGSVVRLNHAYMALTGDITTDYAFARSYDQLDSPGFRENYDESLKSLYILSNFAIHFPWIHHIFDRTPRWVTAKTNPLILPVIDFYNDARREISDIRNEINLGHKSVDNPTIFHELLNSTALAQTDKTDIRLGDEAVEIVAAGIITTSSALSLGTVHILKHPDIQAKLTAELDAHFPRGLNLSRLEDDKELLEWHTLGSLPYLSGCIRESIRLSGGVVARDPRIAPNESITYGSYSIPPGTEVSMSTWHISNDSAIFPDPEVFRPERWITTAASTGKQTRNVDMDRWLVAFGKGSRQCAGMNLAFAELHLTLAVMFRGFDMSLYETDERDVKTVHGYMIPYPTEESKGTRVKINGLRH